ncbi:MAG: hypothetical protein GX238_10465 [Epulopiscium sp.]|nr:hypothetical protein [Candidatus Epulonipiscium sp.]
MNKKFGYFVFPLSKENIPLPFSWMRKVPSRFKNYYIRKKQPLLFSEVEILGAAGYEVQLPLLLEEMKNYHQEEINQIMKKALIKLKQYEVEMIALPTGWEKNEELDLLVAQGREICLFFIVPAILKVIKLIKKPLELVEVSVVGDDNKKIHLLMDLLYSHFNFLTIMTEDIHAFLQRAESIYEDNGLRVNFIQKTYTRQISGDIIINLSEDDTSFYFCQKGSVYFDFSGSKEHTKKILLNRSDLLVIDDFSFRTEEENRSSVLCELAWYSQDSFFRKYVIRGYFTRDLIKLLDYGSKKNLEIEDFYQYGKRLSNKQLREWQRKTHVDNL